MDFGFDNLLKAALEDLKRAIDEMLQPTTPSTPWPRSRRFRFVGQVVWPGPKHLTYEFRWYKVYANENEYDLELAHDVRQLAKEILYEAGRQPQLILRALRRIQAATAWCQARAAGRRRHAEEILRQQHKAVETLEAEAAILSLSKE